MNMRKKRVVDFGEGNGGGGIIPLRGKWRRRCFTSNLGSRTPEKGVTSAGEDLRRRCCELLGRGSERGRRSRARARLRGQRSLAVGAVSCSVGDLRGGGDLVLERGFVVGDLIEGRRSRARAISCSWSRL
ncbi:uncharacterized protein A4U43_C08F25370 [Asparagus officinalis]|nr:uncharacterized protein A4U43_C08F25370 [Asparagus officinalis]